MGQVTSFGNINKDIQMPLNYSASKKAMGSNIKKEMAAGKPQKQAVAIAYSVKRQSTSGKDMSGRRHKTSLGY